MSATSAVEAALHRVGALNDRYRAFVTLDADRALAAAARADAARRDGQWLGVLHGMILAVKDSIDTEGVRAASGSKLFAHHVPNRDAPVVERLRRAGAIVLGKAALMELCFGIRSSDMIGGQVRNPWDQARVPGGSSGGSAAAVALDFVQGALGSDTGGSVRVPAAFCGVTGLRPTHGRVSNRGALPVSASLDTIGPIARSVDDVARLLVAMSGFDEEDPTSIAAPLDLALLDPSTDVGGIRIGVPQIFYGDDVDPEIAAAIRMMAQMLAREGATLVDIDIPGAEQAHHFATTIILADGCEVHARALDERREDFSPQVYERIVRGRELTAVDYAAAIRFREHWRRQVANLFARVDVILYPTTPVPAPLIEDGLHLVNVTRQATRFTYGGSLAGIPGLSVPCGMTSSGLPIGALLEAAWWNEASLLRIGRAWQAATDWHRRKPVV